MTKNNIPAITKANSITVRDYHRNENEISSYFTSNIMIDVTCCSSGYLCYPTHWNRTLDIPN